MHVCYSTWKKTRKVSSFFLLLPPVKVLATAVQTSLTRKYKSYGSIDVGEPGKTEHSAWNTRATSCSPTANMEFTKTCMEGFKCTFLKTIGRNEGIIPFLLLVYRSRKVPCSFFPFPFCIYRFCLGGINLIRQRHHFGNTVASFRIQ